VEGKRETILFLLAVAISAFVAGYALDSIADVRRIVVATCQHDQQLKIWEHLAGIFLLWADIVCIIPTV